MGNKLHDELIRIILREVNNASLGNIVLSSSSDDTEIPIVDASVINSISGDPGSSDSDEFGWTNSKHRGGIEYETNPYDMRLMENFDYKLIYNEEEELIAIHTNKEEVIYELIKDDYDDLIYVKVTTPKITFLIALIFQNYDMRTSLTPYVEEKGSLNEVVILNEDLNEIMLSIEIIPKEATILVQNDFNYNAYGTDMKGKIIDISDKVSWRVDSPNTIDKGLVSHTIDPGTYKVEIDYQSLYDSATLKVEDYKLVLIPEYGEVNLNSAFQFQCKIIYEDGSEEILTDQCEWNIDTLSVNKGNVTNTSTPGLYPINAIFGCKTASGILKVRETSDSDTHIVSIIISPQNEQIHINDTVQFSIYAIYNNNQRVLLDNSEITWSTTKYTILQTGYLTNTKELGKATVTAKYKEFTTSTSVEVIARQVDEPTVPKEIKAFVVEPNRSEIFKGDHVFMRAIVYYYDSTFDDVTAHTTWNIINNSITKCTINENGEVSNTNINGECIVVGTYKSYTDDNNVIKIMDKPAERVPVSIIIGPEFITIRNGEQARFASILRYSDGTQETITDACNWRSIYEPMGTISYVSKGLYQTKTETPEGSYQVECWYDYNGDRFTSTSLLYVRHVKTLLSTNLQEIDTVVTKNDPIHVKLLSKYSDGSQTPALAHWDYENFNSMYNEINDIYTITGSDTTEIKHTTRAGGNCYKFKAVLNNREYSFGAYVSDLKIDTKDDYMYISVKSLLKNSNDKLQIIFKGRIIATLDYSDNNLNKDYKLYLSSTNKGINELKFKVITKEFINNSSYVTLTVRNQTRTKTLIDGVKYSIPNSDSPDYYYLILNLRRV